MLTGAAATTLLMAGCADDPYYGSAYPYRGPYYGYYGPTYYYGGGVIVDRSFHRSHYGHGYARVGGYRSGTYHRIYHH